MFDFTESRNIFQCTRSAPHCLILFVGITRLLMETSAALGLLFVSRTFAI